MRSQTWEMGLMYNHGLQDSNNQVIWCGALEEEDKKAEKKGHKADIFNHN